MTIELPRLDEIDYQMSSFALRELERLWLVSPSTMSVEQMTFCNAFLKWINEPEQIQLVSEIRLGVETPNDQ